MASSATLLKGRVALDSECKTHVTLSASFMTPFLPPRPGQPNSFYNHSGQGRPTLSTEGRVGRMGQKGNLGGVGRTQRLWCQDAHAELYIYPRESPENVAPSFTTTILSFRMEKPGPKEEKELTKH